jgi:signal transduction histidine kinase
MKNGREADMNPKPAVAAAWIAYPVVFLWLHETPVNDMAAAFAFVPAFITVWFFGIRAAYVVAGLMVPIHVGLYLLNGHTVGWDMFAGVTGFFGLMTLAFGTLVFGFAVDRLRDTEQRLAQTDRHISVVAHELRNPLAGVLGLSQTLVDTWDDLDPAEARELAGMMVDEARTLSAIVTDLLDVGRVRHKALNIEPQPIDVEGLVRGIFPDARISGHPVAWGDPLRIGQILRNLVANARDHGRPPIELEVWEEDGTTFFEVSDRGDGVPVALMDSLFNPFVSRGGPRSTGLGLWLSRALAEAMNGALEYRRDDGLTVFRLEVPACSGEPECPGLETGPGSLARRERGWD